MGVVSSFGFQVSMRKLQVFFDEKSGGPPAPWFVLTSVESKTRSTAGLSTPLRSGWDDGEGRIRSGRDDGNGSFRPGRDARVAELREMRVVNAEIARRNWSNSRRIDSNGGTFLRKTRRYREQLSNRELCVGKVHKRIVLSRKFHLR